MPGNHATGTLGILASSELNRDMAGLERTFGWAVQSGAVTWSSGLQFAVAAIAASDYTVNSVAGALYAGGTVTASTQDPTNPRVDIVVITSAGAVSIVAGTPAALTSTSGPLPPTPSSSQLEIARIFIPASGTFPSASSITDRRHPLGASLAVAQPELLLPMYGGLSVVYAPGTAFTANTAYLMPFMPLTASVTLSSLVVRVTTSSGNIDWGIYSTTDNATFTKVATAGSTACPGAALNTQLALTASLKVGTRYYYAIAADNGTAIMDGFTGSSPAPLVYGFKKAASFPLPASITTVTNGTTALDMPIAFGRITTGIQI